MAATKSAIASTMATRPAMTTMSIGDLPSAEIARKLNAGSAKLQRVAQAQGPRRVGVELSTGTATGPRPTVQSRRKPAAMSGVSKYT